MEGWNLVRLSTKTVLTKLPTKNSYIHITSALHFHHVTQPNITPGEPNSHYPISYTSLFQACNDVKQLRQIHAHLLTLGLDQDIYLLPKLVSKYTIYGNMDDASLLFDKSMKPNIFLWTAIISGCIRNGLCEQALALYRQMQEQGIEPDSFIFSSVVKACADLSVLKEGIDVHDDIVRLGFESDIVVSTALVAMYAKCGVLGLAREVFDKMSERNLVSWSAMIAGYSQKGYAGEALKLFNGMRMQGFEPDLVIMVLHASCLTKCVKGTWDCGMP